jgi:hypothetical protein
MTATPGAKGFGSTVKWNTVPIGYCRDIPMPNMTRDKIDMFNQDSPDEAEEFVVGMLHPGEVSFDIIFVPSNAGQVAAIADFLAGTMREMIITGPTSLAYTWTCQAAVTGHSGSQPHKGEVVATVTLALSGKPVLGVTYAGDLTGLVINTGTLSPALTASTYIYAATTTGTSVTVTPTMSTATIIEVWAGATFSALTLISSLASAGTSSAIAITDVLQHVAIRVRVKRTGYATRDYDVTLIKTA